MFVCVTLFDPNLAEDSEICGQYAILSKIDEFYMAQTVKKNVNIDLSQIMSEVEMVETAGNNFKSIAEQYNTEDKLTMLEPDELIPYTSEFNLIKVQGPNPTFANICKEKGARMLEFEPEFKSKLTGLMTFHYNDSTPFKAYPDKTYLVSGWGSIIDTPVTPKAKSTQLKIAYPQLRQDGAFEYPRVLLS